jgi:hypothetical protein
MQLIAAVNRCATQKLPDRGVHSFSWNKKRGLQALAALRNSLCYFMK